MTKMWRAGSPILAGFVVRENSRVASNFRAQGRLDEYLKKHGIVAFAGIDTRALVRRIRTQGAMKGVLSTVDLDDDSLVAKARQSPGLVGRDLGLRSRAVEQPRAMERTAECLGQLDAGPRVTTRSIPYRTARRGARLWHEVEHRATSVRPGLSRLDRAGNEDDGQRTCCG